MHECVVDQISPLMDLKRWLNYLNVSSPNTNASRAVNVELIPQVKNYHDKYIYLELFTILIKQLCF